MYFKLKSNSEPEPGSRQKVQEGHNNHDHSSHDHSSHDHSSSNHDHDHHHTHDHNHDHHDIPEDKGKFIFKLFINNNYFLNL